MRVCVVDQHAIKSRIQVQEARLGSKYRQRGNNCLFFCVQIYNKKYDIKSKRVFLLLCLSSTTPTVLVLLRLQLSTLPIGVRLRGFAP